MPPKVVVYLKWIPMYLITKKCLQVSCVSLSFYLFLVTVHVCMISVTVRNIDKKTKHSKLFGAEKQMTPMDVEVISHIYLYIGFVKELQTWQAGYISYANIICYTPLYLQVRENKTDFSQKQWELFDCDVYLEEVSDVLCIAYSGNVHGIQNVLLL